MRSHVDRERSQGDLLRRVLSSGNDYKIGLFLTQLGSENEATQLNFVAGGTRELAFLTKSPNGTIPWVELEDVRRPFESHAVDSYFADGTKVVPTDA